MLVLARRYDESLRVGNATKITVLNIGKNKIKLGIEALEVVKVDRG